MVVTGVDGDCFPGVVDIGFTGLGITSHLMKLPKQKATTVSITCTWNENKRPRGLDALLGHLLYKRIPVRCKLSSTKIPEYLDQK